VIPRPLLLVLLTAFVVGGCAGHPPANALPPLPPAATLIAHPGPYRGHSFAFAGEIVAVVTTQETSYIEVELLAIDRRGGVARPPRPTGRAFLRRNAPVDAGRYLPGRGVVGSVRFADVATGVVADEHHPYPLLDLLDHRVVRTPLHRNRPRIRLQFQGGVGL